MKAQCKYNNKTLKFLFPFTSWNFYTHKKNAKMQQKENLRHNTVYLEEKNYTSQEKFTRTLFMMFVTFRRSGVGLTMLSHVLWSFLIAGKRIYMLMYTILVLIDLYHNKFQDLCYMCFLRTHHNNQRLIFSSSLLMSYEAT